MNKELAAITLIVKVYYFSLYVFFLYNVLYSHKNEYYRAQIMVQSRVSSYLNGDAVSLTVSSDIRL